MSQSRRHFLRNAWAMAAAAPAYATLSACSTAAEAEASATTDLIPDPEGFLDLPSGFSYQRLSEIGTPMSDGFRVPGAHGGASGKINRNAQLAYGADDANMSIRARTTAGKDNANASTRNGPGEAVTAFAINPLPMEDSGGASCFQPVRGPTGVAIITMAAPQVANLAGKLWATNPDLTVAEVIDAMTSTATAEGEQGLPVIHPAMALAAVQ